MHRTRSILAAFAAVALSATAVFAAAGTGPADTTKAGLERAAIVSEKTVPVLAESKGTAAEHQANKAPEANQSREANESPDHDATTGTNAPPPNNHGALVSARAHLATPSSFANHGAFVRSVAMTNNGHPVAPVTTPPTTHGKSAETHPAD